MAATAAASGPAAPIAWLSRAASGMSVLAEGPSTLIVATARPRYSTVVTASAMATARGSCRAGSANRVVSGATASQPANENISVAAALPTESQPCGANGVQFAARAAVADPAQGREHSGEQPRQPQQRQPGEDRSRPGLGRGQARQEQQAGPEDRPDVQCRAARGGEVRLVHRHN